MLGMIIAAMLYTMAPTSPCQMDATNSKSSDIISDILLLQYQTKRFIFCSTESSYNLSLLRRKSQVEFDVIKTISFSLNQTLFITVI